MPAIHAEHCYTQSANTVWQRIHDFADLQSWLPGVTGCTVEGEGVGAIRTVATANGGEVVEELVGYDDDARQFSYRILKAPGVSASADFVATLTVLGAAGGGCKVTWQADFRAGNNAPADKVEKARQGAEQMYRFCLSHLAGLLDSE